MNLTVAFKKIKGRKYYQAQCNTCSSDRGWKIKQALDKMCNRCASLLANKQSQITRKCFKRFCSIENCDEVHVGKGFCRTHYEQFRRPSTQGTNLECANPRCTRHFKRSGNQKYCSNSCNSSVYYWKNKEKINDKKSKSKTIKEYRRKYSRINRKQLTKNKNLRYKKDINFRIKENLRTRLSKAITRNTKTGSAVKDLGCSIRELKDYLSSQFTKDMSWDNYGKWHIDHIKPLAKFDLRKRDELLKACHYTNLQPLWASDNLSKGSK